MSGIKLSEAPLIHVDKEASRIHTPIERIKLLGFMRKNKGIGLAAPQIGDNSKWCIVGKMFAYNPRIIERSAEIQESIEGCLTLPGRLFKVKRPQWVTVEFMRTDGKYYIVKSKGYVATVWCHEIDHLNNILVSDIGEEIQPNDT